MSMVLNIRVCRIVATAAVVLCALAGAGDPPAVKPDTLKQLSDMRASRVPAGQAAYQRYCAFCHGVEGRGDGLNSFNLKTQPRNFSDSTAMRGKTPGSVAATIRAGGAASGLAPDMPAWGSTLDSITIARLAEWVATAPQRSESVREE
jgi:mono/diheme cytochrome c family protein